MFEEEAARCQYHEFLAYLLLYAASADLEISQQEIDTIKAKIGEQYFDKAYEKFQEWTDYERLQFILACKPRFFDTPDKREKVLHEMRQVFESDNDYSYMEKNIMRSLEKLL